MDINNLWSDIDLSKYKPNTRCLAINTILAGKYLVGPVLGQGGFGITYMGYDLNMETKIAIKEYFPVELVSRDTTTMHGDRVLSLSGEKSITYQQGLQKYVAEAQNVSQFSEVPGVVSVKDFFYENETAYIVMEYIDGISLKDYLKENGDRLSEEETLAIMKPVLEALDKVHSAGIIHRDISPDNIMLTFEDTVQEKNSVAGPMSNVVNGRKIKSVKLIDFGAARMTAKNDQKSLTIILKHGYAPEEQYRTHGEQGPWTDVYALCAVMYRMLTGETPIPAMDRMFKDDLKSFDSCSLKGTISENTESVILKGLAVRKEDRLRSVQELIDALYHGKKITVKIENNKKMIVPTVITAAVLVVGIITIFGFYQMNLLQNSSLQGNETNIVNSSQYEDISNQSTDVQKSDMSVGAGKSDASSENNAFDIKDNENSGDSAVVDFGSGEEEIGEQIAFYHPQNTFDSWFHVLICKPDGQVVSRGWNDSGQCNVQDWDHIVSVKAGARHSLGLRSDGKVFAAGDNDYGQCDVEHWTDIVQISTGEWISFGVTAQGTIQIAGEIYDDKTDLTKVGQWTDIKRIANMPYRVVAGLKYDGTVVFEGLEPIAPIEGWQDVEEMFFYGDILMGIERDGTVRTAALENTSSLEYLREIEDWKIQQYNNDFFVSTEGKLLGAYSYDPEFEGMTGLISAGSDHGVFYLLKDDGTLIEHFENQGNAESEDFTNLESIRLIAHSQGQAVVGMLGKTKDGQTLYYGPSSLMREVMWKNNESDENIKIKKLLDGGYITESNTLYLQYEDKTIEGVTDVVCDGQSYWCLMEDGTVEHILRYETTQDYGDVSSWKDIIQICGDYWLCGLKKDGTVLFDYGNVYEESEVVQICASESGCMGLNNDGTVVVLNGFHDDNGSTMVEGWRDITQIAMGQSHTVGLREDGTVVAVGSNHCGQCDVEEWEDVIYIDAAVNRTIGLTKDGELLIAGTIF